MFSRKKTNRQSKASGFFASDTSLQHPAELTLSAIVPDLPLPRPPHSLNRALSFHHNRASSSPAGTTTTTTAGADRRSIGPLLSANGRSPIDTEPRPSSTGAQPSPSISPSLVDSPCSPNSLGRSLELAQRDGAGGSTFANPAYKQQQQITYDTRTQTSMSNSHHSSSQGKTSSDSGQQTALDRWSQRRLQRLNTEQGFRDQRQGGQQNTLSPPLPVEQAQPIYHVQSQHQHLQSQQSQAQTQPHPFIYSSSRPCPSPGSHPNAALLTQTLQASNLNVNHPPEYQLKEQAQIQVQGLQDYSPAELGQAYTSQESSRPGIQESQSSNQQERVEEPSMSLSNNGGHPAASKSVRAAGGNSRQSVHNGLPREGSGLSAGGGQQAYSSTAMPAGSQGQAYRQQGDHDRVTPQALQQQSATEEMSEDDVTQLVKDHKELREKYTKVKKYYFEKEDQVKQLQNSLAHQRLSQSRTSLDDSEYTTRFNRLDGLIAQLAFSIRKSWRSMPSWLVQSVNKDAVATGKQEMTAAGRAFISCWLVEEVFDKYFHPDLDITTSTLLKTIQHNIRRFAPPSQSAEEEDYLISKVVNWRLSTLEGLQDQLRSPACPQNRTNLTQSLQDQLINALAVHLQDPPPSDLEGGVHMIIELVVGIAIHLPMESRDVVIEYFMPGQPVVPEQMKMESGIPPLGVSIADDSAERQSLKSVGSDLTDTADGNNHGGGGDGDGNGQQSVKSKRGMLSAFSSGKGGKGGHAAQGKQSAAGGSSGSLGRPESAQGKEDQGGPPRVRMAAGIGVSVRGRMVLVKAPVFGV